MEQLSREIIRAFRDIGFVYLKNTGIEDQTVFRVMDISKNFFQLPKDIKQQYARILDSEIPSQGWIELEGLNPMNSEDLKEVFNLTSLSESHNWPVNHDPEFTRSMESIFKACWQLSIRVMKMIALGLGLEIDFFTSKHKKIGSNQNPTTLRTAYYPQIQRSSVKENQMRCGEHSDYGTFTLLFQDKNGGLEVMHKSGQFIAAPYIPNTVLLNIADTLQRWSADTLISTKHRVPIPQSDDMLNKPRRSMAFFVHPDHNASLECFGGLDKYSPITSLQFLKENYGFPGCASIYCPFLAPSQIWWMVSLRLKITCPVGDSVPLVELNKESTIDQTTKEECSYESFSVPYYAECGFDTKISYVTSLKTLRSCNNV